MNNYGHHNGSSNSASNYQHNGNGSDKIHRVEQPIKFNTLLDESLSRVSEGRSGTDTGTGPGNHSGHISDEDSLGSRYSSSMSSSIRGSSRQHGSEKEEAAFRKDRFVMSFARLAVIGFFLSVTAASALTWYKLDRQREEEIYAQRFDQHAEQIIQGFYNQIRYKIHVNTALASSFETECSTISTSTSTAVSQQQLLHSWPNCGISRFERRAAGSRRLAGALSIWFGPILYNNETLRQQWESFARENQYYLKNNFTDPLVPKTNEDGSVNSPYRKIDWPIENGIFQIRDGQAMPSPKSSDNGNDELLIAPIWQSSPASVTRSSLPMYNQYSDIVRQSALRNMVDLKTSVFTSSLHQGDDSSIVDSYRYDLHFFLYTPILATTNSDDSTSNQDKQIVGALTMDLDWSSVLGSSASTFLAESSSFSSSSLSSSLSDAASYVSTVPPLSIVIENTLGQTITMETATRSNQQEGDSSANNSHSTFLRLVSDSGQDTFINKLNLSQSSTYQDFAEILEVPIENDDKVCLYKISVFPTQAFEEEFLTSQPLLTGIGVGGIVLAIAAIFVVYDGIVEKRQARVVASAKRSNAIVRSLFPAGVRNRLMDGTAEGAKLERLLPKDFLPMQTPKARIQNYLTDDPTSGGGGASAHAAGYGGTRSMRDQGPASILGSEPIADFFPATTILFADLAGFTAWSSSREPSQVFMLLETLYGAMDKAAKRLTVFKVETVGDCYVAATGIPDPREDHAVLMVRFARSSMEKIEELTDSLESALGPGTGDLAMRMGIHSGPVTAGVLRGEKSRFQLFGDTMNIAARMENTGMRRRVHISKDTADLLAQAGKQYWLEERADAVVAKGKGQLVTFWLRNDTRRRLSASNRSASVSTHVMDDSTETSVSSMDETAEPVVPMSDALKAVKAEINERRRQSKTTKIKKAPWQDNSPYGLQRMDRLVDYNVDVLIGLLKKIVARRSVVEPVDVKDAEISIHGKIALDEIKEHIQMPEYNAEAAVKMASEAMIEIPNDVRNELRNYIHRIASSYNMNPFHNFEHASHVALSANKLLKRIVMPDDIDYRRSNYQKQVEKVIAISKDLHEATLGISSDPVTQFACIFVALIHDAGHTGVPNFVVAKEEPELAEKYRNKSLAEQRSIDIAWGILMEDPYENLRRCMFPSVAELKHFRELIVNSVMATDIFDKDMSALRKARWQKCFHPEEVLFHAEESKQDVFNRKATIVIEHIIQASDVAHTMQHWHVYQKWNERLFREMYDAYEDGRHDKDPSEGWYKGELWFFDNYVIPLARKLDECGVFGVSSAEYLNYAIENRNEWEQKGEAIVERLVAEVKGNDISDL